MSNCGISLFTYNSGYIPRNLNVRSESSQLILSWVAPENTVTSYNIYRAFTYDQVFKRIGNTQDLTYIDSGVERDRTYYYRVTGLYE